MMESLNCTVKPSKLISMNKLASNSGSKINIKPPHENSNSIILEQSLSKSNKNSGSITKLGESVIKPLDPKASANKKALDLGLKL
jgi:hypothetical protein